MTGSVSVADKLDTFHRWGDGTYVNQRDGGHGVVPSVRVNARANGNDVGECRECRDG